MYNLVAKYEEVNGFARLKILLPLNVGCERSFF